MPRLPSAEDLGFAPSMDYQRGLASIDTSPIARGAEAKAAGIQKLGDGIFQAGRGIEARQDKDKAEGSALEEAQARADLLTAQVKRKSAISDASDATDLEKIHTEGAQADLDAAANRISDPKKRALFVASNSPSVAQFSVSAGDKAFNIQSDAKRAEVYGQLEDLRNKALADKDPTHREGYIQAGQGLISGLEKDSYVTAVDAEKQRRSWAQSYAYEAGRLLDPAQKLALARGGWEGALINRESSNNPRIVNQFGYAGLYQMGAPLLTTLGLYKPGADENLQTWSDTSKDAPGKWSGSFNIPGYPGVRTLADFRENPEAQRAAFLQSTGYYDGQIKDRGLDRYIGQTVGGVPITREGIYSMMHLGGVQGAESALKRGTNAADANGSTVLGYAKMAANAGPGAGDPNERSIAKFLTPEQRETLGHQALSEFAAQERQAQRDRHDQAAALQTRLSDDLASIEATGQGNTSLKAEDVSAALGPQASKDWLAQRARTRQVHEALDGIESLPEGEVERRLQTLQPHPGADGFTDDMAAYTKARAKADKLMQARRADPALAVENLPAVKAARASAQYEQTKDGQTIAPASAQTVVRARLAAQNQLGIPEPMAITKAEAAPIARQLRFIGDDNPAALKAFVGKLQGTYGEYADEVLSATLQHANINRDLAVATTEALTKIARGTVPSPADRRRMDRAGNGQRMDDALGGRVGVVPNPFTAGDAPAAQATARPATDLNEVGQDYQNAGATMPPAPAAKAAPEPGTFKGSPTGNDIGALIQHRADPAVLARFDAVYGPGTATRALAEADRRLGQEGRR